MKKRILLLLPIFSLVFFSSHPVYSQFEEEEFFQAGEWVVTAAKRAQPIEEAPAAVTIITAEEIRQSGVTNLGDLLRRVPGLEVMTLSPSDYEIGARGQNRPMSNGILVLVNGRSVYQDYFGIVYWNAMDLPLEQIEKIEVVRGPGSVLYGANAFHAVVNIIPKTALEASGSLVSITAGPDTIIGTLMEAGQTGRVSHVISTGWTQATDFSSEEDIVLQYPRGRISLSYDLEDKGAVDFEAGLWGGNHETFYDYLGMIKMFSTSHNILAGYQRKNFYFRTYWNSIDIERAYVPDNLMDGVRVMEIEVILEEDWMFKANADNHVWDCEAQQILELGESNLLTFGASYRYNTLDSNATKPYRTQNLFATYFQHEFWYRNYIHSYAGLRYDHHPLMGSTFSPRGSLLLSPLNGHVFRFSVGQSFRNPTLIESFMNFSIPTNIGGITIMGSSAITELEPEELLQIARFENQTIEDFEEAYKIDLDNLMDPEKLVSYEIGYQSSLLQNQVKSGINFFYNKISDLIGTKYPESIEHLMGGFLGFFTNLYEETALGLEVEVRYRPSDWLSTFANYTYTKVRNEYYDELDRRTAQHKINGGITLSLRNGFSSTILVHYVGETEWPPNIVRMEIFGQPIEFLELGPLAAYTLVNLRLAYQFFHNQAEVGVNFFNLAGFFDEHREYPKYGEEIGARITGNVRVSF